ncbi:M28 family metallopeptidase [Acetivibrio mesophilus]|nr:M28 family peptidase [Acetivibrio mesophilus]ODM26233.1 hypothetical protein A7W90_08350 [Clostridium sp. Bc-iso-3]HHV28127.1 Zn-dependent exopeptidase M28 [Clostridium sp.]
MKSSFNFLRSITQERPVGTSANNTVLDLIENEIYNLGYQIVFLPFSCLVWERDTSALRIDDISYEVFAGPFSNAFEGTAKIMVFDSLNALKKANCKNNIIILTGDIASEPLQPKNYPFFYPEEHESFITLLEEKNPKAIITATGKYSTNYPEPFPLFEDGNFLIPCAYISNTFIKELKQLEHQDVSLTLNSKNILVNTKQIIASKQSHKQSKGKIVICAHMDTKYNTPGALDNGTGVAVLIQIMHKLKDLICDYDIDYVFFNSEEYFGATGELEYLEYIKHRQDKIQLVINIDSPCHFKSKTAISSYNANEKLIYVLESQVLNFDEIIIGEEWYSGNHTMFVFDGIPCIAVTSSNLFDTVSTLAHTPMDTLDHVSPHLITSTADFLAEFVKSFVS